jgi:hypothetical protein
VFTYFLFSEIQHTSHFQQKTNYFDEEWNITTYICSMEDKAKPIFNKRIFWDVVFENIDYDAKANFVIERVFERGDVEDIRNCRRYYGDEKVTQALLNAKFLPETRMYLASAVIDKPLKDFRCYTLRQLNPTLFTY